MPERLRAEIERHADELWRISLFLHGNPVAFQEKLACAELVGALSAADFEVEPGVAGLPTAFRARWGTGAPQALAGTAADALTRPELLEQAWSDLRASG